MVSQRVTAPSHYHDDSRHAAPATDAADGRLLRSLSRRTERRAEDNKAKHDVSRQQHDCGARQ